MSRVGSPLSGLFPIVLLFFSIGCQRRSSALLSPLAQRQPIVSIETPLESGASRNGCQECAHGFQTAGIAQFSQATLSHECASKPHEKNLRLRGGSSDAKVMSYDQSIEFSARRGVKRSFETERLSEDSEVYEDFQSSDINTDHVSEWRSAR